VVIIKKKKITNAGNRELFYPVGGSVNQYSKEILQKTKTRLELPYDPAIPLLGIRPKKMKSLFQNDTWTPRHTAALFTVAKIWNQPRCLWFEYKMSPTGSCVEHLVPRWWCYFGRWWKI
jgi:hypothetical protein